MGVSWWCVCGMAVCIVCLCIRFGCPVVLKGDHIL